MGEEAPETVCTQLGTKKGCKISDGGCQFCGTCRWKKEAEKCNKANERKGRNTITKKTLREILKQMGAEKENIKDWMEQLELTTSGENTPVAYPHDIDCCVNGKKDVIKKTTQKNKKKNKKKKKKKQRNHRRTKLKKK